jgi:hypothetical protein
MSTLKEYMLAAHTFMEGGAGNFPSLVKEGLIHSGVSNRELADAMECATSTVDRWAYGLVAPHPRVERFVIRTLWNRLPREGGT